MLYPFITLLTPIHPDDYENRIPVDVIAESMVASFVDGRLEWYAESFLHDAMAREERDGVRDA